MSGLIGKAVRFARSPQGKKAINKAKRYASSPEGKEKLEQVKGRVSGKPADEQAQARKPPAAKDKPPPRP